MNGDVREVVMREMMKIMIRKMMERKIEQIMEKIEKVRMLGLKLKIYILRLVYWILMQLAKQLNKERMEIKYTIKYVLTKECKEWFRKQKNVKTWVLLEDLNL